MEEANIQMTNIITPRHSKKSTSGDSISPPSCSTGNMSNKTNKYFGHASDVSYLREIRHKLQQKSGSSPAESGENTYELDDDEGEEILVSWKDVALADMDTMDVLINTYFQTVHLAYPFVNKSAFLTNYRRLVNDKDDMEVILRTSAAEVCLVLAIGAFYETPSVKVEYKEENHRRFFMHAQELMPDIVDVGKSEGHITCLLLMAFYHLLVNKFNRSWNVLGLAIRIAQGFGLHAEISGMSEEHAEQRRRLWYSLFILERLLTLQLGRTGMIRDSDCQVAVPKLIEQDGSPNTASERTEERKALADVFDYNVDMITFSKIIGTVVDNLYGPTCASLSLRKLIPVVSKLDEMLQTWKSKLPFHLRFDLSHVLENNRLHRRQRNFLAVKFYHLQTLIHRPFACWQSFWNGREAGDERYYPLFDQYEAAALDGAMLALSLYEGVESTEDLLRNFPWWQMTSCLMCVGSILIISSVSHRGKPEAEVIEQRAQTCLKIFEALECVSEAARRCKYILQDLRTQWEDKFENINTIRPSNVDNVLNLSPDQTNVGHNIATDDNPTNSTTNTTSSTVGQNNGNHCSNTYVTSGSPIANYNNHSHPPLKRKSTDVEKNHRVFHQSLLSPTANESVDHNVLSSTSPFFQQQLQPSMYHTDFGTNHMIGAFLPFYEQDNMYVGSEYLEAAAWSSAFMSAIDGRRDGFKDERDTSPRKD